MVEATESTLAGPAIARPPDQRTTAEGVTTESVPPPARCTVTASLVPAVPTSTRSAAVAVSTGPVAGRICRAPPPAASATPRNLTAVARCTTFTRTSTRSGYPETVVPR